MDVKNSVTCLNLVQNVVQGALSGLKTFPLLPGVVDLQVVGTMVVMARSVGMGVILFLDGI